jgi:hypothetical protein
MKFEELLEAGRKMSEKDIEANIVSLAADPRFAALLGFMERRKSVFTRSVTAPSRADNHGGLAHVAGGLFEILNVLDSLKGIIEPAKARGPQPPEE